MNDLTTMIENSENIDIIYLDFRKAFDTVPHERLLIKLKSCINGAVLQWISSFLQNRIQRVRVNDAFSNYADVRSGIPQGSVLGPLLFIVFINDLPDNIDSICKIFADDTKVYGSTTNHPILQNDLLKLLEWSNVWQLKFNVSKCKVLHVGKKNERHSYYMDDALTVKLDVTETEKDVGVTFSPKLDFSEHINTIVKKANQLTGLKRSFTFMDKDMFLMLYKTVIRPHLKYANVIWHPLYKKQLESIERVQRRATKMIKCIKHLSYNERLRYLDLPSIKYRQTRGDLIQTYKIIHNIDNICKDDIYKFSDVKHTRGDDFKLYKQFAKSEVRRNFLPLRIHNLWNSLSTNTKDAPNVLTFKSSVDRELINIKFDYD